MSIPASAALAVALLLSSTAYAQGANGSVKSATNANAATSESTTMGSKAATGGSAGAMAPKSTPGATTMGENMTKGSMAAKGGSSGMMEPKSTPGATTMGENMTNGSMQPTDPQAKKSTMTKQQRANRKASRKAAKMAKRNSAAAALPKEDLGMVKP